MKGEALEQLATLALEYDVAREEETRASKLKEQKRDEIMLLFKEAQTHREEAGGYVVEAVPSVRETIPIKLARQLLTPTQLGQLLQTTTSISLKIARLK